MFTRRPWEHPVVHRLRGPTRDHRSTTGHLQSLASPEDRYPRPLQVHFGTYRNLSTTNSAQGDLCHCRPGRGSSPLFTHNCFTYSRRRYRRRLIAWIVHTEKWQSEEDHHLVTELSSYYLKASDDCKMHRTLRRHASEHTERATTAHARHWSKSHRVVMWRKSWVLRPNQTYLEVITKKFSHSVHCPPVPIDSTLVFRHPECG